MYAFDMMFGWLASSAVQAVQPMAMALLESEAHSP